MRLSQQLAGSASLLDATAAISNWRALLLLAVSTGGAMLITCLMAMTGGTAFLFPGTVLGVAVTFYGSNAVGIMLMDEASGGTSRPPVAAVLASLTSSHRLLLAGLAGLACLLLILLVTAILLLLCKIPVLGPVLLVVVMPLGAVVLGGFSFTLSYVFYPLAAAAIWSGSGLRDTLVVLLAIGRQKLMSVVIRNALLILLVALVCLLIGMVVFSGLGIVSSMAIGIIGQDLHVGMGMMGGLMGQGGLSGHAVAAALGGGLLLAAGMLLPGLIAMRGCCLIYLSARDGLDTDAAEREIEQRRRQLAQTRDSLRERSGTPREPSRQDATPLPSCPHCHAELDDADDVYCGQCGHRLRPSP